MYYPSCSKPLPATDEQRRVLLKILPHKTVEEIASMSRQEASNHIASHAQNWPSYSATKRQEGFLRHRGLWTPEMSRGEAHALIAEITARTAKLKSEQVSKEREMARQRADLASKPLDSTADVTNPDQVSN
jgi:hypothetical protein